MDSDNDVAMEDAPVQWPTAKGKGKAKATDPVEPQHVPENLPWYVSQKTLFALYSHRNTTGLRNTDL